MTKKYLFPMIIFLSLQIDKFQNKVLDTFPASLQDANINIKLNPDSSSLQVREQVYSSNKKTVV